MAVLSLSLLFSINCEVRAVVADVGIDGFGNARFDTTVDVVVDANVDANVDVDVGVDVFVDDDVGTDDVGARSEVVDAVVVVDVDVEANEVPDAAAISSGDFWC